MANDPLFTRFTSPSTNPDRLGRGATAILPGDDHGRGHVQFLRSLVSGLVMFLALYLLARWAPSPTADPAHPSQLLQIPHPVRSRQTAESTSGRIRRCD